MAFGDWVKGAAKDAGSVTTSNLAFASTVTSGNSVIVAIRRGATSGTVTVTDDKSNTYTQDATRIQTTDGHTLFVFRCSNIVNAPQTITVTFGTAVTMRWCQEEYVGNFALHGTPPSAIGFTATPSSGNQVTTATCAIVGSISNANTGSAGPMTAGSGYTKRHEANANAVTVMEDKNGAQGAGTHTANGTYNASIVSDWAAILCAYSDGGGGVAANAAGLRTKLQAVKRAGYF